MRCSSPKFISQLLPTFHFFVVRLSRSLRFSAIEERGFAESGFFRFHPATPDSLAQSVWPFHICSCPLLALFGFQSWPYFCGRVRHSASLDLRDAPTLLVCPVLAPVPEFPTGPI